MEKRGRLRKLTRLPVRFGAQRLERMGMITNVSVRGLYISTNAVLARGATLCLQVQLPGGDKLLLDGRVIRSRRVPSALVMISHGGMGVRLENPPPNWRESLSLSEDA
jgi:hypothetical protein